MARGLRGMHDARSMVPVVLMAASLAGLALLAAWAVCRGLAALACALATIAAATAL